MKKLITILGICLLYTNSAKAQITLDTIVHPLGLGYDFITVQISDDETKYFIADTLTNTFGLYNMDWTPFLTNISVPKPFNVGIYKFAYQCLYITRTLFDCDSTNIEYLYTSPTGPELDRKLFVMRTDGTTLLQLDSSFCVYCFGGCLGGSDWVKPIVNTSSGARLFVIKTLSPGISIYSLCGQLPDGLIEFANNTSSSYLRLFPNPTSEQLTFEINPPDNTKEYEIVIMDSQSRVLERKKIEIGNYRFTIDLKNFSSGNYFYSLCTKDKSYQSGKFIITR